MTVNNIFHQLQYKHVKLVYSWSLKNRPQSYRPNWVTQNNNNNNIQASLADSITDNQCLSYLIIYAAPFQKFNLINKNS